MKKDLKPTSFSLRRIVENIDRIPFDGEETPKLSQEQKRQLKEMAAMFDEYGKAFTNEERILEAAKNVSEIMKLAETYAVNESGDWFQSDIIKNDFTQSRKKVNEFNKLANECYVKMQKLGVLFEDLKHVVGRYYQIDDLTSPKPLP